MCKGKMLIFCTPNNRQLAVGSLNCTQITRHNPSRHLPANYWLSFCRNYAWNVLIEFVWFSSHVQKLGFFLFWTCFLSKFLFHENQRSELLSIICRRRLSHNSGAKICFFLLICKLFLNYFSKIFKKVYFPFEIFKKNGFSRMRTHSFLILFFIILIYSYYVSAKNAGNLLKTRNLEKCLWNSW